MAKRICPCTGCAVHEGSCPNIVERGRCGRCRRAADRARGTRTERGYGPEHQAERRRWQRIIRRRGVPCVRGCGRIIRRDDVWHLDHDDEDRTRWLGPSCVPCNTAAGGRAAHH